MQTNRIISSAGMHTNAICQVLIIAQSAKHTQPSIQVPSEIQTQPLQHFSEFVAISHQTFFYFKMKTNRIISSAGMYTSALCEVRIIAQSSKHTQPFSAFRNPKRLELRLK